MSILPRITLVCITSLIFVFTGCETVKSALRSGLPQPVTIDSVPSYAHVYINGDYMGTTPVTTELPRKVTHEVRLEKDGYIVMRKFFSPQPNEAGEAFVRFGLMEDLGLYVDLSPTDMIAELSHTLIPLSATSEPFQEMAYRVMLADALLDSGAISRAEHSNIYNRLVDFYSN